jgi:hypothetical protein
MVGTHGRTDKRWRMLALERAARGAYGRRLGGSMCLLTIVVITSIILVSNREVDP